MDIITLQTLQDGFQAVAVKVDATNETWQALLTAISKHPREAVLQLHEASARSLAEHFSRIGYTNSILQGQPYSGSLPYAEKCKRLPCKDDSGTASNIATPGNSEFSCHHPYEIVESPKDQVELETLSERVAPVEQPEPAYTDPEMGCGGEEPAPTGRAAEMACPVEKPEPAYPDPEMACPAEEPEPAYPDPEMGYFTEETAPTGLTCEAVCAPVEVFPTTGKRSGKSKNSKSSSKAGFKSSLKSKSRRDKKSQEAILTLEHAEEASTENKVPPSADELIEIFEKKTSINGAMEAELTDSVIEGHLDASSTKMEETGFKKAKRALDQATTKEVIDEFHSSGEIAATVESTYPVFLQIKFLYHGTYDVYTVARKPSRRVLLECVKDYMAPRITESQKGKLDCYSEYAVVGSDQYDITGYPEDDLTSLMKVMTETNMIPKFIFELCETAG